MANSVISHLISKDAYLWLLYYVVNATPLRKWLSDKAYLTLQYRCIQGKSMNWENPQSFNEKLQWLKVYDHNPEYSKMDCDQKNMLHLSLVRNTSSQR